MKKMNSIIKISYSNLDKLKSIYILRIIFNSLFRNKMFDIMKYNKKLQKRLDLNINYYKELFQLYVPIEIELKPDDNQYGNFINISDKNKKYFHIYFDDSNEEISRNY